MKSPQTLLTIALALTPLATAWSPWAADADSLVVRQDDASSGKAAHLGDESYYSKLWAHANLCLPFNRASENANASEYPCRRLTQRDGDQFAETHSNRQERR